MTKKKSYKFELSCKKEVSFNSITIHNADDAYKYAMNLWKDDINLYESSFIILLDMGNNVIGWAKISQGGISQVVVDVKIIAKYVITTLASGVILLHNHPSGGIKPSEYDNKLTQTCKSVMKLLGSTLFDHLIVTENAYFSYAESDEHFNKFV